MTDFSFEERMSWTEHRQTTRDEDRAYSLLGIFGVSMVPIYGEGEDAAFKRLQREIRDILNTRTISLDEEQRCALMNSLRFEQIDARHLTIKNAHAKTCRWLLNTSAYQNWLDPAKQGDHRGFLWIKGKPGTGKSTLMKFALANARRKRKDTAVIAYFFNARGENLEKSTVGTYRSLLLQLLEQLPVLHTVFESTALSARNIGADHQWSDESLQTLFEQVIQNLGNLRVICFIDALDECETRQIRSMISFFERIGHLTASSGIQFQVCFSSRHYPEISIEKGLSLVLEGQEGHTHDITNYLGNELKIGKSKVAEQIRNNLQDKASGVFMWVVLVVDILNEEFDRGQMHALKRRIQEIPTDLHELFRDILTRDSRDKDQLILCIQWVLFAKQPMSPEHLYFAVLSGVEPETVTRWDPEEISKDSMRRFLLNSSKGLTEITKSKVQKVQFIHESVRDFLLKDNGLGDIWPELSHNFEDQSHAQLRQCCSNYIRLGGEGVRDFPEVFLEVGSNQITPLRTVALDMFPFLEYAVQNVLYHADAAEATGLSQEGFLQNFPRIRWIRLDNLFEKHKIRRHTKAASLLYLLAERNFSNLIKASPFIEACVIAEAERYGSPFFAAMATGSKEAVCAFVNALRTDKTRASPFHETYLQYRTDQYTRNLLARDFTFTKHQNMLKYLVDIQDLPAFALAALANVIKPDCPLESGRVIHYAAIKGYKGVVKLLFDHDDTQIDMRNTNWETPLLLAAQFGHEEIVGLLLNTGKVDINAANSDGCTSLILAARNGHTEVVKLLLGASKTYVHIADSDGCTSLMCAARNGHKEMVELLLSIGKFDVNAVDDMKSNTLMWAVRSGYKDVVELLLGTGKAELNAADYNGWTSLMWAALNGRQDLVELLLSTSMFEPDAKSREGDDGVDKLPFTTDKIDIDVRDRLGRTAITLTSESGNKDVVELLQSYAH